MFHSMAALGLSHTTPSVAWVHTYIYILMYSHMLPLSLLMHARNTHAHNYSHTHPYADVYTQHSHSLTPSGDPEVQPAHLSPPWPVPSHQHASMWAPLSLGQASLDSLRCARQRPTHSWTQEGWSLACGKCPQASGAGRDGKGASSSI